MSKKERIKPWACDYHRGKIDGSFRCKYFEIGLGRSGTRSVFRAVKLLGLSAMHGTGGCLQCLDDLVFKMKVDCWDLDIYRGYEYSGHVASVHWQQLAEARPDAKFILPTRELSGWSRSARKHLRTVRSLPQRAELLHTKLYGSPYPKKVDLIDGYNRHIQTAIKELTPTGRLLVLDVFSMSDDYLWGELAGFVGRKAPQGGTKFPWKQTVVRVYQPKNRVQQERGHE